MFIHIVDIVTSDIFTSFIRNTCNICHIIYIYIHTYIYIYVYSAKRMMRYNPGKIVIHGCKLRV